LEPEGERVSGGPDVVVVGAGVAGLAASIAARRAGAEVWIVEGPAGASVLAGGAWDIAISLARDPPLTVRPRSIEEALDDLARERPTHPLARLRRNDVIAALVGSHRAIFDGLGIYRPLGAYADAEIVVGDLGLPRRVAVAQRPVLDLGRVPDGRIAVACFPALRSFDGRFIAASLNEDAVRCGDRRRFVAVEIEFFRRSSDSLLHLYEAAALLDQSDVRQVAIRAIARGLGGMGFDAVLVPPLLGLTDDTVHASVENELGIPVGESVEALASTQSLRLRRRIAAALEESGVVRRRGRAIRLALEPEGPEVALDIGESYRPGAVVLATGKYVGGGIVFSGRGPREALANLPLWSEGKPLGPPASGRAWDPGALFGNEPCGSGPAFAIGVGFDEELHPLDARGRIVSPDLFACGSLLEGASERDSVGLGNAATTGWLAGTQAAARAGR
jgi:anaerobic glycerol-3-phosphate dehydrogenase